MQEKQYDLICSDKGYFMGVDKCSGDDQTVYSIAKMSAKNGMEILFAGTKQECAEWLKANVETRTYHYGMRRCILNPKD